VYFRKIDAYAFQGFDNLRQLDFGCVLVRKWDRLDPNTPLMGKKISALIQDPNFLFKRIPKRYADGGFGHPKNTKDGLDRYLTVVLHGKDFSSKGHFIVSLLFRMQQYN
jgi:hypothetical protein